MNTIETKFAIGDVTYTASAYSADKDIIKAIKIEGLKKSVSYGFNRSNPHWSFFSMDQYYWIPEAHLFQDEEKALKKMTQLQEKKKKKEDKEQLDEIKELEKELEEKRKEAGINN